MLNYFVKLICVIYCLIFYTAIAQAELPQVSSGLSYLATSQNPDGFWHTDTLEVETTAATISSLDTLKTLNQTAGTPYATGTAWLQAQSPQSVDYIAQRMRILGLTDAVQLVPVRDTLSGAWGGDAGYETDILDTALALQALKSTNYSDATIINPALAYLTTSQNTDGGWGFYKGDDSNVYMTAIVSATLQQFPQMTTIATAVSRGTSFLLAHQNTDGGFGSSPSTVYETALAYAALAAVSTDAAVLGGAVNYLTTTQSANGSWNDDPYSTALALKALYFSENKPPPPPAPPAGGTITGAVVDAATNLRVPGVAVVLGSNDLIRTTSDSTGSFTLNDVPPGSQSVNLSLAGYATKTVSATVAENTTFSLGNVPMISSYSTGTIAGTVTDPAGKPIADVAITVTGAWNGTATTGADGAFSFTYVTPGQVAITAAKAGYETVTGNGAVYARTTLSFSPRMSTTPPQVTTGMLVGRVVDSYWGLPIDHLPEEQGVMVRLSGEISVEPDPDNRGYFEITNLAAGSYQVTVGMNGFASQTFRVVVTPGGITDLGTIRLESSFDMTLTGKVTDALTGAPIAGAEVRVDGGDITGWSDFTGAYVITGIPHPSTVKLKAVANGYIGTSFTIGSSPWTHTLDIALSPETTAGSLTGTVIDAATGTQLTGVLLTLIGDPAVSTTTNSTGTFTFDSIRKGPQQVELALAGYASRILTTSIIAGAVNNVGEVPLAATQLPATVRGSVLNGVAKAPFAGVQMAVTGTGAWQTATEADGTYKVNDVTPGVVTVTAAAIEKPQYYGARFTGELAPGGILIFSPTLTTLPPSGITVNLLTDKASYQMNENVGITVNLQNKILATAEGSVRIRVTGTGGAVVFESDAAVSLAAEGGTSRDFSFVLPGSSKGGTYTIKAEMYDPSGVILGVGTKSFAMVVSDIRVTPTLPAAFSVGANAVSFALTNSGTLPVAAGVFEVALKDPDGQVVYEETQNFSLPVGESKTLVFSVAVPPLKFGAYTLSYTRSDETTTGITTEIPLPNSIGIAAVFDKGSYRIRETAILNVTLTNTGRFNLDPNGSGIGITAAVPDAGYSETKSAFAPAVGNTAGSMLQFQFPVPESTAAGQHPAKITVVLPSGSTQTQTAKLTIPESSLSLELTQSAFNAGEIIRPVIANTGGVDTSVQYKIGLYDAKAVLIAEVSNTETAMAGSPLSLALSIPSGAVDGSYSLVAFYKNIITDKEAVSRMPVSITGVKATLSVMTSKDTYLVAENITGLGTITNTGTALSGGNAHLQVSTGPGTFKQKTWTTQVDFQTGVRSGVDTYGVNDWIIPNDDFDAATIDLNRWWKHGNVTISSGKALFGGIAEDSLLWGKLQFEGDFDIQVDFNANNALYDLGAQLSIASDKGWFFIYNCSFGYVSGASIDGQQIGRVVTGAHTLSGRLRITRTGSTMVAFYSSGTGWIEVYRGSHIELSTPGAAIIGIGGRLNAMPRTEYDNFKVNSGRIKTKNQTVDSVRLLPLSDNFDDGTINTERWRATGLSGYLPTESNGSMNMRLPNNDTSESIFTGISLRPGFTGDFEISVDYNAPTPYSARDNQAVDLSINTPYYWDRIFLQRAGFYSGPVVGTQGASTKTFKFIYNVPSFGKIKSKRVSSMYSTYYWTGTAWTQLLNESGSPEGLTTTGIGVWTVPGSQPLEALLDNFKMTRTYPSSGLIKFKYDQVHSGSWGKLSFTAGKPSGTSIQFRTRTSESEDGLSTAPWSEYFTVNGTPIPSPPARWIEVEATLSTTDPNATPLLHDVSVTYQAEPGEILWQTDVPVNLAPAALSELNSAIGTLGVTGKLYFQGELKSSTGQSVASAEYPFYIQEGNFQLLISPDKKVYRPGETVTISGEARNLTTVDAAGLVLQVKGNAGELLQERTIDIPANGSHPFTITTTAGTDGSYSLTGVLSQNSTPIATAQDQYETASPILAATLTAPDNVGTAPFDVTVSITNSGKVEATTTVTLSDGNGTIGTQSVAIPAGETKMLQYSRQITGTVTYEAVFTGDLSQTQTKTATFSPTQLDRSITGKVVTDKISYNPNEQVTLTATATSALAEENLSATVTIVDSTGRALHSTTTVIPLMAQGQTVPLKNYWNTGTYPAGSYDVTLRIIDPAGVVLSTSRCGFAINSTTIPTALLKGEISVNKQSLLTGEPVTVSYSITNTGNVDLSDIALTVQTVNLSEETVYDTITGQTALTMGASYSTSGTVSTAGYTAKDYLVVLKASINGVEETLAGTYFRVEGAPSAPALAAPATGADVETPTPALSVNNAADPNDDRLTYDFQVHADSGLNNLVASGTVPETAAMTAWTVPGDLTENMIYYWRARAYDGLLYGDWMPPASFRVNVANDPPTAPTVASPADTTSVDTLSPALAVNNASDPDSASLTYNFQLASDPELTNVITSATGIFAGEGLTSWQPPLPLAENTWYYWRAQADDWFIEGPWSVTTSFFVNTTNDAPTAPAITTPAENATITSLSPDITAVNSIDPDSSGLLYFFEADTSPAFDSVGVIRSGSIPEGSDTTTWNAAGLSDNTQYYLRVKASDGLAESPWSGIRSFVANTANDPPTTPALANPSNGAGVNQYTPTLSVHKATDLDHDVLTYEFELFADAAGTTFIARAAGIAEGSELVSWVVPETLTENLIYYWRARASDGALNGAWMPPASFMVNTANDAPGAPVLSSPEYGSSVSTLTPVLAIENADDPDSDSLTYDFEIYNGTLLAAAGNGIPQGSSGTTAWTASTPLADNTVYQWRARAYDGDLYGPWTAMAIFTVHLPVTSITATIDFDPNTLNRSSNGTWVVAYIELPSGHDIAAIDVSSVRLEGTVPAEVKPCAIGDHDKDGIPDLMVKFRRSEAIKTLPAGNEVPVHVTGKVGDISFEGVDVIRVIER